MASKITNKFFSSDNISPGYVESVASSKKKTKENLRTKELVPSEILANASALETLLNAYYDYMNSIIRISRCSKMNSLLCIILFYDSCIFLLWI